MLKNLVAWSGCDEWSLNTTHSYLTTHKLGISVTMNAGIIYVFDILSYSLHHTDISITQSIGLSRVVKVLFGKILYYDINHRNLVMVLPLQTFTPYG